MKKFYYILSLTVLAVTLLVACSTKKNTAASRRYHAFTARYNTYFNGKTSFDEQFAALQTGYKENYTEQIFMYPISAQPKDKKETGGAFDRAIEKGNKAIKQHSITKKPVRKAGWRGSAQQVAMQNKEEYNPFLKHCWMLVAESQFYNADFLQAAATFSYISRHYADEKDVAIAANIWQARCYAEMDWLYETESALDRIKENGIPAADQKEYDRVRADYLVKAGKFEEAIPALEKAIKGEKNRRQRTRMRYLLGQIQTTLGKNDLAYQTFGKVASSNPPYELEFAARIRQAEVLPASRYQSVLKTLNRMAKSSKNTDYLDQVYTAIGNVYMSRQDTANAIKNYALGIEKSTQNALDKAICQIKLGDIYFQQRDYVKAQPCFSGALGGITKEYKDYDRVSRLSAVLDELVVHVEAVHLQDSLQTLAKMPEAERLAVIDKIIEEVKEQEKREAEEAAKEEYLAEQESRGLAGGDRQNANMKANLQALSVNSGGSAFYFYNDQTVAQGKTQFQNKWGKRANQDDWRRRDKQMSIIVPLENKDANEEEQAQFDENGNPIEAPVDSMQLVMDSLSSDPKSREYYLQQIPLTEEDVEASNVIIADGLYNMGMIYKDKLENKDLSVETFEELERRFPDNKYRMDYYYQSYLMGLRYHDKAMETKYKNKLIEAFPESDYATAVSDPNYEYNMRMMDSVQDSLYEIGYNRYLDSDTSAVRKGYRTFSKTYPLATLIPKYMFVNALTYVLAGDADGFKAALQELVDKYPKADVTDLANEMLKGILNGRKLVQGSMSGMKWNLRFGLNEFGELSAADSARQFTDVPKSPHRMVLLYQTGAVDKNQLLYAVAAYNFAHFEVKSFDLVMEDAGTFSMLMITGFNSIDEVLDYYKMIYEPDGYASKIDAAVSFFPFSNANYETLMHGKTLEEYMTFFAEKYGAKAPQMVSRWRVQVEADDAEQAREDAAVEKAADINPSGESEDEDVAEEEPLQEDEAAQEEALEEPVEETPTEQPTQQQPTEQPEQQQPTEQPTQQQPVEQPQEQPTEQQPEQPVERLEPEQIEPQELPVEEPQLDENMDIDEALLQSEDTATVSQDSVLQKPKEITLEYLEKRRALAEEEERLRQEEADQAKVDQRKEAAELKKQQAKDRETLRKQKAKEAKERLKQKEKERKEKEKVNKQRQKEKEAARKAAQKEKEAARKAAQKEKAATRKAK